MCEWYLTAQWSHWAEVLSPALYCCFVQELFLTYSTYISCLSIRISANLQAWQFNWTASIYMQGYWTDMDLNLLPLPFLLHAVLIPQGGFLALCRLNRQHYLNPALSGIMWSNGILIWPLSTTLILIPSGAAHFAGRVVVILSPPKMWSRLLTRIASREDWS